ncbi:cysteine peptidase family C39 domain-containing protein [Xenorhabdus szentirmaii]|uniref:cysteine peptidase family C39 domain-containing protein n=1 Tax=Xenorhabdus szentirmaii TaxID=290112 RepID=UPI0038CD5F60
MSQSLVTGLVLIAGYHGINLDKSVIKYKFSDKQGSFGVTQWILAAKEYSLHARLVSKSINRLKFISFPALVLGEKESKFILLQAKDNKYLIYDIKEKNNKILDEN